MMTRAAISALILVAALLLAASGRGADRGTTPSSPTLTAVDTHAHIFPRGATPVAGARYVPNYDATLTELFQQFATHGISHGVLVQPSFLGTDNTVLLAALRAHPGRLRGVAVVDPGIAPAQLAELAGAGVVGLRLNLVGQPLPNFEIAPWPVLLGEVRKLGWLVEVQREARDLPHLVGPLLAAGLNVVVDHFGRPDPKLGVEDPGFRYLLAQAPTRRLWVKLSGAYRNGPDGIGDAIADAAAPLLVRAFGAERLLWGSDWPHTQFEHAEEYADARAQLDRWITDPAARRAVLQTTPTALFRF
jgi:predicted TIM-barrel fold metal-dependent hydrolase